MRYHLLLSLIFCLLGCRDKPPGKPETKWHAAPFGRVQIETIYPLFYKDKVIVSQNLENGSFILCALNRKDGSIAWQHRDTSGSGKHLYYNLKPYLFRHILLLPSGNRLLAFHLDDGRKLWDKTFHEAAEDFLEGTGNVVFRNYYDLSQHQAFLYRINAETGDEQLICTFEIPPGQKAYYRTPAPLVTGSGDTTLVFTHISQEIQSKNTYSCLTWLDTRGKSLQTDTIYPVNTEGLGVTKQPLFDRESEQLYFVANDELACFDVGSKKQLWRSQMPRDMLTSVPLTDEKRVFFPAEDGNLYALDKFSGGILWKAYVSGTPGRLFDDGTYLHVVGGGDGKWHIVNKKDGKEAYLISSPNTVNYPSIFFRRSFALHPGERNAVLSDGKDFFYYQF